MDIYIDIDIYIYRYIYIHMCRNTTSGSDNNITVLMFWYKSTKENMAEDNKYVSNK